MWIRSKWLFSMSLLLACAPEPRTQTSQSPAPLISATAPNPISLRLSDEVIVDIAANGEAFVGRVQPVPENSDADRALIVRWLTPSGLKRWSYSDQSILDVRFVAHSTSLLVLTAQHRLLNHDPLTGRSSTIDESVYGPISLDELGVSVVYTRGEPPELRVVQATIATGVTRLVAGEMYPTWCPTISADGTEIIFVGSPTGTPRWYRYAANSQLQVWDVPSSAPLLSGPTAAVLLDHSLTYESDGTLYTLAANGAVVRALPSLGAPIHAAGSNSILLQGRELHTVELAVLPNVGSR